jgi:preprotein translocase subunit YajC
MWNLLIVLADDAPKQQQAESPLGTILMLGPLLLLLFYFIVLRPGQRRQQQERDSLLTGLKKNDKVVTIGGIYGTVITVSDTDDEVTVKVDDNTRLKMTKSSIARNISNEEAAKAAKDNPKKEGAA